MAKVCQSGQRCVSSAGACTSVLPRTGYQLYATDEMEAMQGTKQSLSIVHPGLACSQAIVRSQVVSMLEF